MTNATITRNEKFNSLEISFAGKPDETTRASLKALGFRWNPKKSVWYGFATEEEAQKAITGATVEEVKATAKQGAKVQKLASLWERTNTSNIPEHNRHESTREIAKQTREHFKKLFPELKISCRIGKGGWASCNEIMFELVASPYDVESEAHEAIEAYIKAWLDSFNYDNSDAMTDYFDVNFYCFPHLDRPEKTEATAEILADIDNFNAELAKATAEAEKKAEEEYIKYLAEQEEQRKAWAEREAKETAEKAEICEAVKVVDLAENDQYIINAEVIAPHGKECNTSEILEDGTEKEESAIITRELHLASVEMFEKFSKYLLHDFDFLAGKGGTTTFDERMENVELYQLTPDQIESVKWIIAEGVAVYVNNVLMLIIDPQGYNYARYTYIVKDYSKKPLHEAEQEEKANQNGEAFHIPQPIEEQAQNIEEGARYTLVYNDPWTMCATMHHVTITKAIIEDYAQYKNSLYIEYIEQGKKKAQAQYLHNNSSCLLFSGWLPSVPEEITRRKISETMSEVLNCGRNVKKFLVNVAKYYAETLQQDAIINTLHY